MGGGPLTLGTKWYPRNIITTKSRFVVHWASSHVGRKSPSCLSMFDMFVCRQLNSLSSCVGCSAIDSSFPSNSLRREIHDGDTFSPRHLHMLCSTSRQRQQLLENLEKVRAIKQQRLFCYVTKSCVFFILWPLQASS